MKKLIFLCLTFAALMAHATVIDPGGTVDPNEVTAAVGAGSLQLLTISGPYLPNVLPADISANYIETAYADTTNPFNTISGIYDTTVVLQITVGKGTKTIERATLGYFGGYDISVSYLKGSTVKPTFATLDTTGSVAAYDFVGLTQGEVETLVVYTNARGANADGRVSIQDGSSPYNVGISVSPEPFSATLFGAGLAFLAVGVGRRHGRTKAMKLKAQRQN